MSLANVSTTRLVLDAQTGHKDDTCTKEDKCVNCGEKHALYNQNMHFFIKESMIFNISEYQKMFLSSRLGKFISSFIDRG